VTGHHAEIDAADLRGGDRHLECSDRDQPPPTVVRSQRAHPAVAPRGLLPDACHDFRDQIRPVARGDRGQSAALHRCADKPGAATAAGFEMGVDLLREHLGTLAVQSGRKRLTRNVTPHPCIVAHGRSACKEQAKTRVGN